MIRRTFLNDLSVCHEYDTVRHLSGKSHLVVTTTMVMFSLASLIMTSSTSWIVSGSSAEVGSSKRMIFVCAHRLSLWRFSAAVRRKVLWDTHELIPKSYHIQIMISQILGFLFALIDAASWVLWSGSSIPSYADTG